MNSIIARSVVPGVFKLDDFKLTADKTIVSGQWNQIGYYEVGITEAVELGNGYGDTFESAEGRLLALINSAADTPINGKMRATIESRDGVTFVQRLFELPNEIINRSEDDWTKQTPFPFTGFVAEREKRIVLYYMPDEDKTIDVSESKLNMAVTIYSR